MLADEDDPLREDVGSTDLVPVDTKLVVVYRSRGVPWLLVPPLLILAGVVAIVAYRRAEGPVLERWSVAKSPTDPIALVLDETPPPTMVEELKPEEPKPKVDPVPVPLPEPAPTVIAQPEPAEPVAPAPVLPPPAPPLLLTPFDSPPASAAPEPANRDAVGFDPEAAKAASDIPLSPVAPPPATIPERQVPENPAPALNPDAIALPRSSRDFIMMSRRQAQSDRQPFHSDLKKILATFGPRGGEEIQKLCNRYGRDTRPEILQAMNRDLVGPATRLSPIKRVQRMRKWGVPETIILDDLAETALDDVRSRNGIKSDNQAWVRAARVLISIPPTTPDPVPTASR